MHLEKIITYLNEDLAREYAHWHFYMAAAMNVTGLHRQELQEFFMEEAAGEMKHIQEWGRLIIGLGGTPVYLPDNFHCDSHDSIVLLTQARDMEAEVVNQFVQRMDDAEDLAKNGGVDKIHARYIQIFLEDQMMDSRSTVDHLREMIKGS